MEELVKKANEEDRSLSDIEISAISDDFKRIAELRAGSTSHFRNEANDLHEIADNVPILEQVVKKLNERSLIDLTSTQA